jgi:hypothetical protein
MTLSRFSLPMFIAGIIIILLNTIIFNYENPSTKSVFFTSVIPLIILLAISAYFVYERVTISSSSIKYRSLFKEPLEFRFQEIDSLRKKKVETASGSDGINKFYIVFTNSSGQILGEIPFGFFKKDENRRKVFNKIKQTNPNVEFRGLM